MKKSVLAWYAYDLSLSIDTINASYNEEAHTLLMKKQNTVQMPGSISDADADIWHVLVDNWLQNVYPWIISYAQSGHGLLIWILMSFITIHSSLVWTGVMEAVIL